MHGYIAKHYGSRSGLLRHGSFWCQHKLGLLRRFASVDWSRVDRLVFVCKGNICRSPYAEFRARASGLRATSFGLNAASQDPAYAEMVRLAETAQLDLSSHRTRPASEVTITGQDLLIGMEPWHGEMLTRLAADAGAQVTLLGVWGPSLRPHIEDPFGLSSEYLQTCLTVIDEAVAQIAQICRKRRSSVVVGARSLAWYHERPVLVAEAESFGAVAVIRSLGRAGYPVHTFSSHANAIGLGSNFAARSVVSPRFDVPNFLDWLRQYVAAHGIRAIIPSEGMLLAMQPAFAEFAPLLPYSQSLDTVYAGMSKADVYEALVQRNAAGHLPPTLLVKATDPLPALAALRALGAPLFLKVDQRYCRAGEGGKVYKAATAEDALERLAVLHRGYDKILIQGYVPGQGVGVFFLWWNGRLHAEFMHRRLHEVPHGGGVSSLRESCLLPAVRDDALAKLRCLNWDGVAMMEYRWDEGTGEFYFMEMNGRFWGSLHLALFAGVDFPALLVDALFGHFPAQAPPYPLGLQCRHTFPGEVHYVWSCLRDGNLPLHVRAWAFLEFFVLSLNPTIHADLLFPGDRQLYWQSIVQFLQRTVNAARARLVGKQPQTASPPDQK